MPGGYLYGFYKEVGEDAVPVKISCDSEGRLIIDPALLLVDPPEEDLATKGVTSEWIYDHWKNVAAHHAKFTEAEAREAINDILDANGYLTNTLHCQYFGIDNLKQFILKWVSGGLYRLTFKSSSTSADLRISGYKTGVGYIDFRLLLYLGGVYVPVATEKYVDDKYGGLVGDLYWSCAGVHFDATNPDVDDVEKSPTGYIEATGNGIFFHVAVFLPQGATITGVEIFGNAGASAEVWELQRITLSGGATSVLASAAINTEDTSITTPIIDNATYAYYFNTSSLDTGDRIYGARITYTL